MICTLDGDVVVSVQRSKLEGLGIIMRINVKAGRQMSDDCRAAEYLM